MKCTGDSVNGDTLMAASKKEPIQPTDRPYFQTVQKYNNRIELQVPQLGLSLNLEHNGNKLEKYSAVTGIS